jgi:hypothetical protein
LEVPISVVAHIRDLTAGTMRHCWQRGAWKVRLCRARIRVLAWAGVSCARQAALWYSLIGDAAKLVLVLMQSGHKMVS